MNLLKYSSENLALLLSEYISISSLENSALAECKPLASTTNLFGSAVKVHASLTTRQSSTTSTKVCASILITLLNSQVGSSLSSPSTLIKASVKSLFILSFIVNFKVFSSLAIVKVLPNPHLLNTAFKLSRLIPKISSLSTSNCENSSAGMLKCTIATFAGSKATNFIPSLLIFNLTSVTNSEIMLIRVAKNFGSSNLSSIQPTIFCTFKLYYSALWLSPAIIYKLTFHIQNIGIK